jgi:hypothetical protein
MEQDRRTANRFAVCKMNHKLVKTKPTVEIARPLCMIAAAMTGMMDADYTLCLMLVCS